MYGVLQRSIDNDHYYDDHDMMMMTMPTIVFTPYPAALHCTARHGTAGFSKLFRPVGGEPNEPLAWRRVRVYPAVLAHLREDSRVLHAHQGRHHGTDGIYARAIITRLDSLEAGTAAFVSNL